MSSGAKSFGLTDSAAVPRPATGSGSDMLVLNVSEDPYQGDAQFTVVVDGRQLGGTFTATALHSAGASQDYTFKGDFGAGQHVVAVKFLNDAYAGTAATDRNLYVNGITYNGTNTNQSATLWSVGAKTFVVSGGTTPAVTETGDHGSLQKNLSQTGTYTVGGDTFVLSTSNVAAVTLGTGASQIKFIGPSTVLSSDKVFADETTLPVLDPGRGKTKTGRLWCYAVDDRPWAGSIHPAAAYVYSEDRRGERPAAHLAAFRGILQVDGYAGFGSLVEAREDASIRLAFCWAHLRRPFYEFYTSTGSPLAAEVLARIAKLYEIEAEIRGKPPDVRQAVRQQQSRPLVEDLHLWLEAHLPRVPGWSDLAKAMRYALRHWDGLILYLDDPELQAQQR